MQYDQPTTASDVKDTLNSGLSASAAAAISTLLNLDTVETVSVAGWDGVAAPTVAEGTTAQLVAATIAGDSSTNLVLDIPTELSSAQAFVFDTEANLSVSFATPAAPAAEAALFAVAADATANTSNTPDLVVISGDGNDVLTFSGDQNVFVDGGQGNDVIVTAGGNDTIYAGSGNNVILSGAGDDHIYLGGTQDSFNTVDAGEGYDIVSLEGSREEYTAVAGNSNNVTLTGVQTASITNAEFLSFDNNESIVLAANEAEAAALRLFQGVLGRDADVGGAKLWADQADQGVSINDIAQQFLDSAEFKSESNDEFVASLFTNILGRETADPAAVQAWLDVINTTGASRSDVVSAFANSEEAIKADQSNGEYVQGLYESILGRPAEDAGVDLWVSQLVGGASRSEVADSILNSEEAATKANSDFIDSLYQNALDRPAEDAGKAAWLDYIAQGHSLTDVAVAIVGSDEATKAIDNVVVLHGAV